MTMWDGWPGPVDYEKERVDRLLKEQGKSINDLIIQVKNLTEKVEELSKNSSTKEEVTTSKLVNPKTDAVKIYDTYIQPVMNYEHTRILYYGLFQKISPDTCLDLITKKEIYISASPDCTIISNST